MKKISLLLGTGLLAVSMNTFAAGNYLASDVVTAKSPHIPATQQSAMMTEVFMELDNKSTRPEFLVAAFSPVAAQTQLHETVKQNGEETMRQITKIAIKPKGERELQAGGLHVMLMGLKRSLNPGEQVPVTLIFADGSSISLQAAVG